MDNEAILAKMQEALDDAFGLRDEEARIEEEMVIFTNWLAAGKNGSCPVDLTPYLPVGETIEDIRDVSVSGNKYTSDDDPVSHENQTENLNQEETVETDEATGPVKPVAKEIVEDVSGESSQQSAEELVADNPKDESISDDAREISETEERESESLVEVGEAEARSEQKDVVEDIADTSFSQDTEMRQDRDFLEDVRKHIENEDWREALNLAKYVEEATQGSTKEVASGLRREAQNGFDAQIDLLLKKGQEARSKENVESARIAYEEILGLVPEHKEANSALQALAKERENYSEDRELISLESDLRERRNIERLGKAVYAAETRRDEDNLPSEYVSLLKDARSAFDTMRVEMGQETTQMHFGSIAERQQVVEKISNRIARGEEYIFDVTLNKNRPAYEMLGEANALLTKASEDTVQRELNRSDEYKTKNPRQALDWLNTALKQPFGEGHRRLLEKKKAEVELFATNLLKAEEKEQLANQTDQPLEKLEYLLQASSLFPEMSGLTENLARTRSQALNTVLSQVKSRFDSTKIRVKAYRFADAREKLAEAEQILSGWVEKEMPAELSDRQTELQKYALMIEEREVNWSEYIKIRQAIRERLENPEQRQAAIKLFEKYRNDERFADFDDLKKLATEVNHYKGAGEQLDEAHKASAAENWQAAYKIANTILEEDKADKFKAEFEELRDRAYLELAAENVLYYFGIDYVYEANYYLERARQKAKEIDKNWGNEGGRSALDDFEARLDAEIAAIEQASSNQPMQDIFNDALSRLGLHDDWAFLEIYLRKISALRKAIKSDNIGKDIRRHFTRWGLSLQDHGLPSYDALNQVAEEMYLKLLLDRSTQEKLDALALLQHVANDKVGTMSVKDKNGADLPDYALSLYTYESKQAARLLRKSLRQDLLPSVKSEYEALTKAMDVSRLKSAKEKAFSLRDAGLLKGDVEKEMAAWFEIAWGKHEARQFEKTGSWVQAKEKWQALDKKYFDLPEVRAGLRRAKINEVIYQTRPLIGKKETAQKAIALIKALQNEPGMRNAWELEFALVNAYQTLGEFAAAFVALNQTEFLLRNIAGERAASMQSQLDRRRKKLDWQKSVHDALEKAQKEREDEATIPSALEGLQTVIKELQGKKLDVNALLALRDEIFDERSTQLLLKATDRETDRVDAVKAMVDLQNLEGIMGISQDERKSVKELQSLRSELTGTAEGMMKDVDGFHYNLGKATLDETIATAKQLKERLEGFDAIISIFKADLKNEKVRIDERRATITKTYENLRSLRELLEQAASQSLWDAAVRNGNFDLLDQLRERMDLIMTEFGGGHSDFPATCRFKRRLGETRELYAELVGVVGLVKEAFVTDEDFVKVVESINKYRLLPTRRKPNSSRQYECSTREDDRIWQTINAATYQALHKMIGERLFIPNTNGEADLLGWDDIQIQARERHAEYLILEEWQRVSDELMDKLQKEYDVAVNTAAKGTQIALHHWQKFIKSADAVIDHLDTYSEKDSEGDFLSSACTFPLRSLKAKDVYAKSLGQKKIVHKWKHDAELKEIELSEKPGFPSPAEFSHAVKKQDELKRLIAQAKKAGAVNDEQRRQLAFYESTLKKLKAKPKRRTSFLEKLGLP